MEGGPPPGRLIPNVSNDWVQNYRRKSYLTKSKSPNKSEALQSLKQTSKHGTKSSLDAQLTFTPHSPQANELKTRLTNALGPNDDENQ